MGNPVPPPCRWPLARRLAAIPDTTECPRAALYIIPALPNVRDAATFQLVRATYIDTVKRLAPAGAFGLSCREYHAGPSTVLCARLPDSIGATSPGLGCPELLCPSTGAAAQPCSGLMALQGPRVAQCAKKRAHAGNCISTNRHAHHLPEQLSRPPPPRCHAGTISDVIPTLVERNTVKGGVSVHTTILFSGSCEAGKAAARTLHVKLLGDVRLLFYVPAPRAKSLFGDVYMITVSHPYLVSQVAKGNVCWPAAAAWQWAALGCTPTDATANRQGTTYCCACRACHACSAVLPTQHGCTERLLISSSLPHLPPPARRTALAQSWLRPPPPPAPTWPPSSPSLGRTSRPPRSASCRPPPSRPPFSSSCPQVGCGWNRAWHGVPCIQAAAVQGHFFL